MATETEEREETRGSERWAEERGIAGPEIKELRKLAASVDGELVYWWIRGQPAIDAVFGAVKVRPGGVGPFVDKLMGFKTLRPRLDVFPYGIPAVEEVLVKFEHGVGGIH